MSKELCFATGKVAFETKGEAQRITQGRKRTYSIDGKRRNRFQGKRRECRVYLCEECGKWHLTSIVAWDTKKKLLLINQ